MKEMITRARERGREIFSPNYTTLIYLEKAKMCLPVILQSE
jgi:hypothetical protein